MVIAASAVATQNGDGVATTHILLAAATAPKLELAPVASPLLALSLSEPAPQSTPRQWPAPISPDAAGLPPPAPASLGNFNSGGASAALLIALLLLAGAWHALVNASRQRRPTSISLLKRAPPG